MEVKKKVIGSGKPLICVPVMETEKEKIIGEIMELSKSCAEVIEWRVDAFCDCRNYNEIREILDQVRPYLEKKIFLYTFRTKKQGGLAEVSEEELNDIHDLAVESKCVDLLDMEYFEEEHPARKIRKLHQQGMKIVASHHDFEETPEKEVMKMLLERMCEGDADIVKLAVMPNTKEDVLALLSITSQFQEENPDTPVITMSMGRLGVISRLCGEAFGSCMTFAAHEKCSAPGQMKMDDVADILDRLHNS